MRVLFVQQQKETIFSSNLFAGNRLT